MAMRKKSTLKPGGKAASAMALSDDVLTDLKHVISLFKSKSPDQSISRADFRNIVHNFGYYSIRQKEFEEELRKHGLDPKQPTYTEAEIVTLITSLWCQRGREEEARDCFKLFDRGDKKQISISDVKRVLEENEIPFSNEELNELMLEADPTNTGYVSYDAFLKLCKITPSVTVTV